MCYLMSHFHKKDWIF